MSLRGVIRGRTIELEEDPHLPDGTAVEVELQLPPPKQKVPLTKRLQQAAQNLREDYLHDPELTAFRALEGDAWHE
ncbi:hypothetical protein HRbin15_00632 [bacterium HR15]|nr:hypothetical protein HRbin15_00632 [bacterium HR15]